MYLCGLENAVHHMIQQKLTRYTHTCRSSHDMHDTTNPTMLQQPDDGIYRFQFINNFVILIFSKEYKGNVYNLPSRFTPKPLPHLPHTRPSPQEKQGVPFHSATQL